VKFTKMHGLGNDYIYVNCLKDNIENASVVAKSLSDRHFGVGSDGLVLILPSKTADFRMQMFNSDGSEAEMCGNAIRCVGKYVYDNGFTNKKSIKIETLAGIKVLELNVQNDKVTLVKVDMGEPILDPERIPVKSELSRFVAQPILVSGMRFSVTCVSMGNPHAIIFVEDVSVIPLEQIGPKVETFDLFPNKINTEFVQIIDSFTLKMRVWERGAGETLACGTGACAALVASVLNGFSGRKAQVILPGGDLSIEWNDEDNHVYMTGPAIKVFDGEIEI